jgi:hypothetical protein
MSIMDGCVLVVCSGAVGHVWHAPDRTEETGRGALDAELKLLKAVARQRHEVDVVAIGECLGSLARCVAAGGCLAGGGAGGGEDGRLGVSLDGYGYMSRVKPRAA